MFDDSATAHGIERSAWFRAVVLGLLAWMSVPYMTRGVGRLGQEPGFMHRPDLIFHEAGHVLFGLLGNATLTVAGGSLFQLLVPAALAAAFLVARRDPFGAAVMGWWWGQSVIDLAPYIADAKAQTLILLTGGTGRETGGHDWHFLLGRWGILDAAGDLARAALVAGRVCMVAALAAGLALVIAAALRRPSPAPPPP